MIQHLCKTCGGSLIKEDSSLWSCPYCGNVYEEEALQQSENALRALLDEFKLQKVANLRRNLYDALVEENPSQQRICSMCDAVKAYLPDDFMANFFYVAACGTSKEIAAALRAVDVSEHKNYIDIIASFSARNVTKDFNLPLMNLIERAYKNTDLERFEYYATLVSDEMMKVDSGTYSTILPRDAFIAYSSKDMKKVEELVELLEDNNFSCFVAARNLRHGRNAAGNYQNALEEAMDNCKTVIFVSSLASRNTECDALKYELSYIKKKDIENSPHEYRQDYTQIPKNYKKPRIEYRIQNSTIFNAADKVTNEFFKGYEYALSPEAVAERLAVIISTFSESTSVQSAEKEKAALSPAESFIERASIFLADGFWDKAGEYCEKALDIEPNNAEAYLIKFLASKRLTAKHELLRLNESLDFDQNFKKVLSYASKELKSELMSYSDAINKRIGEKNRQIQELAQKKENLNKEIALAEAEKTKIEKTKQDLKTTIAEFSASTDALRGLIEKKRKTLNEMKFGCTPLLAKASFLLSIIFFLAFGAVFTLCILSVKEMLPPDIDILLKEKLLYLGNTEEDFTKSIFICLAVAGVFTATIFAWDYEDGFTSFMFSLSITGLANFFGYLIVIILVNDPLRIIGDILSSFFGLFEKVQFKQDGTDALTFAILALLNLIIGIIAYIVMSRSSTYTSRDIHRAKRELAREEKRYHSRLHSNAELNALNKKLKETELLYQRTLSTWNASVLEMYNDYVNTAKAYSLSQDVQLPYWITNY